MIIRFSHHLKFLSKLLYKKVEYFAYTAIVQLFSLVGLIDRLNNVNKEPIK